MVYQTIKAFSEVYNLNYSTVKKWKQRGKIICNKNGSIDDDNQTNKEFLELKGLIIEFQQNNKSDSDVVKNSEETQGVPLMNTDNSVSGGLADLSPAELEKLYKLRRITELESKIKRLEHNYNQDRGVYIERDRAVGVLLAALKSIVAPLVDFGTSPVAGRIAEVYRGDLPPAEQEREVSQIMNDYVRNFEDSLVLAEQQLRGDGDA